MDATWSTWSTRLITWGHGSHGPGSENPALQIGKLNAPDRWFDALMDMDFDGLPVTFRHSRGVEQLPPLHRDPFDRLLVSQAIAEDLPLITADPRLSRYDVETIW